MGGGRHARLVQDPAAGAAGQAAVQSANLRIDQLINTIQDIRLKNFTTSLFQPVPGIYSYQTWAKVPDDVTSAKNRVSGMLTDWWDSVRDQNDVLLLAFEAVLLWLGLTLAAWHGVHRLRRWRQEGEPPFWRRASSAGGVILLRMLPVVAPIMFLYGMIAEAHALRAGASGGSLHRHISDLFGQLHELGHRVGPALRVARP